MKKNSPLFSIILPTRNRPRYVEYALQSLLGQGFNDFECIVVNNSDQEIDTKNVFTKTVGNDARFKYVRPTAFLAMHENWQLGISHSNGQYISLLPDKAMLFPNCLSVCKSIIDKNNYDLINWWSETYNFQDEDQSLAGYYSPFWEFRWPENYKTATEIKRRLSFLISRLRDGRLYFRGKICFGFYRRDLADKIVNKVGTIFAKFCPDYTSLAAGLGLATNAYDIGMPLCLSINSKTSHGQQCDKDNKTLTTFIKQSDEDFACLSKLPFPGIGASLHNLIAYDYINIFSLTYGERYVKRHFNPKFLLLRIQEDLAIKKAHNPNISSKSFWHLRLWNRIAENLSANHLHKILRKGLLIISKSGMLPARYAEEIQHRQYCLSKHACNSPLEALGRAHEYYKQYSCLPYAQ